MFVAVIMCEPWSGLKIDQKLSRYKRQICATFNPSWWTCSDFEGIKRHSDKMECLQAFWQALVNLILHLLDMIRIRRGIASTTKLYFHQGSPALSVSKSAFDLIVLADLEIKSLHGVLTMGHNNYFTYVLYIHDIYIYT